MSFTRFTEETANISALPDRPNDTLGMKADDLKAAFDQAGNDIKEYINDSLLDQLEATTAAESIGVAADGLDAATLKDALEELVGMIAEAVIGGLTDDCVQTSYIQDGAVTSEKIGSGEVKTANLANLAVTSLKIGLGEVKGPNIDAGAVTSGKIGAGAVGNAALATGAVKTTNIYDGAVTTAKLGDESVTTAKIGDLQVRGAKINNRAVTSGKIALGGVEAENIKDGAVTTAKIADRNVTSIKIGLGSVTSDNIGVGSVIDGKLGSNCVNTANIKDSAVTTAKIASGAVTYAKTSGVQASHKYWSRSVSKITAANGTTTVTCSGLTDDYDIVVSPAPDNFIAWRDCGLRCSARSGTTLTFTAETPMSSSMTAYIMAFLRA